MPRTGRNGTPMPPAWRARNSAPQGYSRQWSRPACTAARKFGAMPYSSRPTWAKWRRSATPAPTARSTLRPPVGTVINPRRRRPWRMSSRIRAMGAARVWPPRATKSPSWTSAAAVARSVQTGGIAVSRYGVDPQVGQQVEEDAGGGAPDHLLAVLPVTHPGGAALTGVGAGAPAFRGVKLRHRQGQQTLDLPGTVVKVVGVRNDSHEGGDVVAGDGGYRGEGPQHL